MSAIDKRPVVGPVKVHALGLEGDAQADPRVHGGEHKALHCYPWAHHTLWQQELPDHPLLREPGAFGENLSLEGLTEADVCLGDVWQVGGCVAEVSQGRQPCFKLNLRFGVQDMAARMQRTGRTGWYLRVVQPGEVAAGDRVTLQHCPHPAWSIARLLALIHDGCTDPQVLRAVLQQPLPPSWQRLFERRLQFGAVEDASPRLHGPG
ncbi:MOSC domain-containing protein [Roseateles sp. BYS87W]|uniref:MOSC domain-containing protein n=1 Tax=Pelomonas baiyunensis TaxID=3299026 RepID=A0ABW7H0U4_9BURK